MDKQRRGVALALRTSVPSYARPNPCSALRDTRAAMMSTLQTFRPNQTSIATTTPHNHGFLSSKEEARSLRWKRLPRYANPTIYPPKEQLEAPRYHMCYEANTKLMAMITTGSRICRAATHRGWSVVSISRSGTPHWPSITSSPTAPDWSADVSWQKGDVLDPSSYTQHLEGADAVIHSMGILLEADYKGVISGRESPIKGLQRAFSSTKAGTLNPLERKGERLSPMEGDGQVTYEVMNRDTGTPRFHLPTLKPPHRSKN
jgi:hypothetical protein